MTPHARYLEEADAAGLLDVLAGHSWVAGPYTDPVTGQPQCYVEYCAPALWADPAALGQLSDRLARRYPDAEVLVLRVPGTGEPGPPWTVSVTYVRHRGQPVPDLLAGVTVAGPEHDPLIVEWLVRAGRNGYAARSASVRDHELYAWAEEVVAAPHRRSYLALADGAPVGHVTLLPDCEDEVTGDAYIDFVDLLVEPGTSPTARDALVAAAAGFAADRDLPLLGNVVHQPHHPTQAERVLTALLASGWSVDHQLWSADAHRS
jgi:hypothetical protein